MCCLRPPPSRPPLQPPLTLQSAILGECVVCPDPNVALTLSRWMEMFNSTPVDEILSTKQRSWDAAGIGHCNATLDRGWSDPANMARLLAARDEHSGDWRRAYPISSCGLRVDNDIIRIAAGLRLGCISCKPHKCGCGAPVDSCGTYGLSCRRSAGRASRHSMVNDIIHRAMTSCDTPSVLSGSPTVCSALTIRARMVSRSFRGQWGEPLKKKLGFPGVSRLVGQTTANRCNQ